MDPFIFLLVFILSATAAIIQWLMWMDRQDARARLNKAERNLQAEILFAPEPYDPPEAFDRYERECRNLREEMSSIIERHGIHPFDSIKPF
tara:strand:+ start:1936 stop:2208 length:273 start_codon:yes stop_codon:yes gene_type:complete